MSTTTEDVMLLESLDKYNISGVKAALDSGANIRLRGKFERTLLHFAIELGSTELVTTLLNRNAEVDAADSNGLTPLHYAIFLENLPIAKLLLEHGADPLKDTNNLTPMEHLRRRRRYYAEHGLSTHACDEMYIMLQNYVKIKTTDLKLDWRYIVKFAEKRPTRPRDLLVITPTFGRKIARN